MKHIRPIGSMIALLLLVTMLAVPAFATETTPETTPTITETIPTTAPETTPPETITQVIEVVETIDYSATLEQISTSVQAIEYAGLLLTSFALFAVVVCLCYFCYKFLRIFF